MLVASVRISLPATITARTAVAAIASVVKSMCAMPTPSTGSLWLPSAIAQTSATAMKVLNSTLRPALIMLAPDLRKRLYQADAQPLDGFRKGPDFARADHRQFRRGGRGAARPFRRACGPAQRRGHPRFPPGRQPGIGPGEEQRGA